MRGEQTRFASLYLRFRRCADVAVSAAAIVLVLPVMAAVAGLVMFDLGRPVLFRQVRPGRYMRPFTLHKFRTMRDAHDRAGFPLPDHERTTPISRFIRRSRLDELPQLFNVLVGDMTVIGPRPLLPRDQPDRKIAFERSLLRPGITGWAQVSGGHQLSTPEKVALDRWYANRISPALDAQIIADTFRMVVFGEHVNARRVQKALLLYSPGHSGSHQSNRTAPVQTGTIRQRVDNVPQEV